MTNLLNIYQENEADWYEAASHIMNVRVAAYIDQELGQDIGFDYSRSITDKLNYDFTTDDYTDELKNSTDEDAEDLLLEDRRLLLEYIESVEEAHFEMIGIAQYHNDIASNISDFF